MRLLYICLILAGLCLLFDSAYDECRGVARAQEPSRYGRTLVVARSVDPKVFRNLMSYEWGRGIIVLCGGLILRSVYRRQDRLDPFSPDFAGNASLDELNEVLSAEQERRIRRETK